MYQDKGIHQMTEGHRSKEQSSVIIIHFFRDNSASGPDVRECPTGTYTVVSSDNLNHLNKLPNVL